MRISDWSSDVCSSDLVEAANAEVARLFVEAEAALAPERASASSSFLGAFGVLLREGLEALLIVIAMMAFLRKTGRTDVMGYVHGGRSEEHTSELQSLMRISYAVFCLKQKQHYDAHATVGRNDAARQA